MPQIVLPDHVVEPSAVVIELCHPSFGRVTELAPRRDGDAQGGALLGPVQYAVEGVRAVVRLEVGRVDHPGVGPAHSQPLHEAEGHHRGQNERVRGMHVEPDEIKPVRDEDVVAADDQGQVHQLHERVRALAYPVVYHPEHSLSLFLAQRLPQAPIQRDAPTFRRPVVDPLDYRALEHLALTEHDHEQEDRGEDQVRSERERCVEPHGDPRGPVRFGPPRRHRLYAPTNSQRI